jgi:hypothetical protein
MRKKVHDPGSNDGQKNKRSQEEEKVFCAISGAASVDESKDQRNQDTENQHEDEEIIVQCFLPKAISKMSIITSMFRSPALYTKRLPKS